MSELPSAPPIVASPPSEAGPERGAWPAWATVLLWHAALVVAGVLGYVAAGLAALLRCRTGALAHQVPHLLPGVCEPADDLYLNGRALEILLLLTLGALLRAAPLSGWGRVLLVSSWLLATFAWMVLLAVVPVPWFGVQLLVPFLLIFVLGHLVARREAAEQGRGRAAGEA